MTPSHSDLDRRQLMAGLAGTAALAVAPRAAAARAVRVPEGDADWPTVAALLSRYVDRGRVPGAVAIIGRGADANASQLIARGLRAFGDTDRPVDDGSVWRLYSMTKPITGMAMMALVGDGLITLDQPIADILPAYARMMVQRVPDGPLDDVVPARSPITIRQLITHTAGLGYGIIQKGPIREAYLRQGLVPGRVTRLPIAAFAQGTPVGSLEAFADRLATLPLVYQPGTRWSYSVGLDLAGRLIELVSGKPFDRFLKDRFFDPLGMDRTGFQVVRPPDFTANHAVFLGQTITIDGIAGSVFRDPPAFPSGGAGLVGPARDYDRFLAMLLGGGQLGRERVMTADAVRTGLSDLLAPSVQRKGSLIDGAGFGAGGRVSLPDKTGRNGGIFGWAGAAGTIGFVDPARGLRVGAYLQYMPADAYGFQTELPVAVLADASRAAARTLKP